jgi:predicted O-methyltransferase YrrM
MIDLFEKYLLQNVEPEPEILYQLRRQTNIKVLYPNMISGPIQGRFLSLFTKLIRAKSVLEIGTYTGYAALCFAESVGLDGFVDTIDINEETTEMAKEYAEKANLNNQINFYVGDAMDILPNLDKKYDLVFIDADKQRYQSYMDLIYPKLEKGATILVDNVLWHGKVYNPEIKDPKTEAIRLFNKEIQEDERFSAFLLPIRDGIYILQKK